MVSENFRVSGENINGGIRCKKEEGKVAFMIWLIMSLVKKGIWEERQELCRGRGRRLAEGIVWGVEDELRGRIKWDIQRWGKHAAKERWKNLVELYCVNDRDQNEVKL